MGVDYDSEMGIGFEVKVPDDDEYDEYFNKLLKETHYLYSNWGNEYSGDHYFAVLLDKEHIPHFADKEHKFIQFGEELRKLYQFLLDNNVNVVGTNWLVGGIHVW